MTAAWTPTAKAPATTIGAAPARPKATATPTPVSYTHLDVYKRQGQCRFG